MYSLDKAHEPLLLKPRDAAKVLSISERQLWQHSEPRGPIPVVRIGNCVRYNVASLQEWAKAQEGGVV